MKAGAPYEYHTGLPVRTFAKYPNQTAEEQVTITTYDFADRPLTATAANGATTTMSYWDNLLRTTTLVQTDTGQSAYSFQDTDGAGQIKRRGSDRLNAEEGSWANWQYTNVAFDY